jgi:hypothetical protein
VLFAESGQRVLGIKIAKGARGKMVREAPLVGASFVSETNAPLPPGVLNLQVAGAGGAPVVSKIECFDASGKALVGVTLTQR